MLLRDALIASLVGLVGYASEASSNSCSNVDALSSYDQSGLRESDFGISAVGTFRIEGEADETKQPLFNLTIVNCENKVDDAGRLSALEKCKVTKAVMWPESEKPDPDKPNCSLDLDLSDYSMK
jgi:hypothetical protein